jgi:4-cresol dehydrogenase (hydroxylating)
MIWLEPIPSYYQTCTFVLDEDNQLDELIDTLQQLRLSGLFPEQVRLYNDYKLLASKVRRPDHPQDNPGGFLSPDIMEIIRKAIGMGSWIGVTNIPALGEEHGGVIRRAVREALAPVVSKLAFSGGFEVHDFSASADLSDCRVPSVARLNDGSLGSLRSVYSKKTFDMPTDPDPDRDGCGVIWCSPAAPFRGTHVRAVLRIIVDICVSHRFDPNLSIVALTEREVVITVMLVFDRDLPGEDERAICCYSELFDGIYRQGYIPYRLGIQSMNSVSPTHNYGDLVGKLKKVLDPNDILAPGRYDFRQIWRPDR